jgi:hypothetical protein
MFGMKEEVVAEAVKVKKPRKKTGTKTSSRNEENSNQKETCDIEGDREEITHEGDEIKTESSCEEGC